MTDKPAPDTAGVVDASGVIDSTSAMPAMGAVLYAKDVRVLADFYAAVAGLAVRTADDGYVVLGGGGGALTIVRIPPAIADTIRIETPPARREATPIKLVFAVASIAAARQAAARHGGAVDAIGREWTFEGATVCDGTDSEGNVFQLRSPR